VERPLVVLLRDPSAAKRMATFQPLRPFNQPTTEPASDAGSVKAAVPGTFNPCAGNQLAKWSPALVPYERTLDSW
jgi:hypothetical protein